MPVIAFAGGASASPIEQQEREVERITDELQQLEVEAMQQSELASMHELERQQLEADVAETEERVAEREAEVDALREELELVAANAFVSAGSAQVSPMLRDTEQYNQHRQAEQYSRVALDVGTVTSDDLDEAIRELEAEQEQLANQRDEARRLADQAQAAQAQAEQRSAEYEQLRQDAEARLGELIEEERQRRAEEERRRLEAERRAAEEEARRQAEAEAAQQQQESESSATSDSSGSSGSGSSGSNSSGSGGGADASGSSSASLAAPAAPSAPPTPSIPPASSRGQTAVNAARSQLGVPYRYASAQPGVAFDCSGLTAWAWAQAGVSLPHQSRAQAAAVPRISDRSQLRPGDLIFSYSPISHVAIYSGNGNRIHAPNSGSVVSEGPAYWGGFNHGGRPG